MATEKYLQSAILKYCKQSGLFAYKNIQTNIIGIPDIMINFHGRFLMIEVKSETGVLSEMQKHRIEQIKQGGGLCYAVNSYPKFIEIMQNLER